MSSPTCILHLFDAAAGWQQRVGATQLMERLAGGRFTCAAATLDGRARTLLTSTGGKLDLLSHAGDRGLLGGPLMRRYLQDHAISIVHAWSVPAALAIAQASAEVKLVVELFDPAVTDRQAKMLRSIQRRPGIGVACTSATVRRRLVERGVEPGVCTVIRPGVDFAVINAARKRDLRGRLGLDDLRRVFIVPEPATRSGGQFTAYWATAVRSFLGVGERLILPGWSPEQARITRLAARNGLASCLCCPGESVPFEELLPNADLLLVPSAHEVPTTAIGWAMAAGLPVVATAVQATAELLGHKHNSLLIKPDRPKRLAIKLAAMLDQKEELAKVAETARGQAYRMLSASRYVDQHTRLYENLMAHEAPGEGITDPAIDQ